MAVRSFRSLTSTRSLITPPNESDTFPTGHSVRYLCFRSIGQDVFCVLALLLGGCGRPQAAPPIHFDTATVRVGGREIRVELANTPERRERGLMFRDSLAPDSGMLFVYPDEDYRSFWMKNTRIPLSIAFAKSDGWIANILDMPPLTLNTYPSGMRVQFALEMNKGWFKQHGVRVGSRIEISPEIVERAR